MTTSDDRHDKNTPTDLPTSLMTYVETLERENRILRSATRDIHFYSRRYCDGRNTYAPTDHNEATHALLALGVKLDGDPISKTGPFASDGMYGLTDREHQALARQPWPDTDPVSTLRKLHALAVEASRSDSTSSAVRHARDELVRVCLSFGGES